jgi:Putative zinc-finger
VRSTRIDKVKQTQSNPVQVELARLEAGMPHPDEDLLTAFAEDALSKQERGRVMEHLASCAECRKVLSLAAAAAPEAMILPKPHVVSSTVTQRNWLPWLATAAALVLVSSAVLLYVRGPEMSAPSEVAVQGTKSHEPDGGRPPVQSSASMPAIAASGPAATSSRAIGRTHWRINEAGRAERSSGDGTWQAVLPEDHTRMTVISVSGDDVWLGGEKLRLFHSSDNGATWQFQQLPSRNGIASPMTHIRFQDVQKGVVEAADGARWSTLDGGRTWK